AIICDTEALEGTHLGADRAHVERPQFGRMQNGRAPCGSCWPGAHCQIEVALPHSTDLPTWVSQIRPCLIVPAMFRMDQWDAQGSTASTTSHGKGIWSASRASSAATF